MPNVYFSKIITNTCIAENVHSIVFACKDLAAEARAGQFLHVKCGHSRLLRRPISICSVSGDEVRFVFEIKGEGTKQLSRKITGETLDILGPLGNGFSFPSPPGGDIDCNIILVGGGIGTPPLLFAAQHAQSARCKVTAVLGFRDAGRIILTDEFKQCCRDVLITTDDGSAGIHGSVTTPLEELLSGGTCGKHTAVLTCGPYNMLKAVAGLCKRFDVPCQASLEERMACGVGACLVCACATTKNSAKEMSRVCKDGPVFDATSIMW